MLRRLFKNSRFWILLSGIVLSINIAGVVQLFIPSGTLQVIRIEQYYGFISIVLVYMAVLASPLTKAYPGMKLKEEYLHARRAIGVLGFYFAFLHVYLSFFQQLGGFVGVKYYSHKYNVSLLFGVIALFILFLMAATSLDWAVDTLGFANWKRLHRFVYLAGVGILIHVILIGPHFAGPGILSSMTGLMLLFLLWLEGRRFYRSMILKNQIGHKRRDEKY